MPIFEFKCKTCGKIFECLCIRSNEKDQVVCPSCGKENVEPMFSAFSTKGSTASSSSCVPKGGFS